MNPRPQKEEEPSDSGSALRGAGLALLFVGLFVVGWRLFGNRMAPLVGPADAGADAGEEEDAAPPPKPVEPRCVAVAPDAFVIGDAPPPRPKAPVDPDAGADAGDEEEDFDELAPFAVSLGRGALYGGGFAVGALRDAEGGSVAMVATVGPDGKGGKLTRLGRSRGDLNPPTVTGAGNAVLAAMLEPNASGRAIKIAKVEGDQVTWGPELPEGRDESMDVDLAVSGRGAVVAWDEVTKDGKRSMVVLSTLDTATMKTVTAAHPVSSPKVDAESPRLIARPGGFWLIYAALGRARAAKDEDTGLGGEAIQARWLEVLPLDESGSAVSLPRAVTPKDGHALAYDVEAGEDGGLVVAWRDDDTPTGSSGGPVQGVTVRLSAVSEARVLAEDAPTTGVPDLLPGWLSVASLSGATRIAPMTPKGELAGELRAEALIGNGEVLAGTRDAILVARPAGKAMKLSVLRCLPEGEGAKDGGP
jgi:hypothetical protein